MTLTQNFFVPLYTPIHSSTSIHPRATVASFSCTSQNLTRLYLYPTHAHPYHRPIRTAIFTTTAFHLAPISHRPVTDSTTSSVSRSLLTCFNSLDADSQFQNSKDDDEQDKKKKQEWLQHRKHNQNRKIQSQNIVEQSTPLDDSQDESSQEESQDEQSLTLFERMQAIMKKRYSVIQDSLIPNTILEMEHNKENNSRLLQFEDNDYIIESDIDDIDLKDSNIEIDDIHVDDPAVDVDVDVDDDDMNDVLVNENIDLLKQRLDRLNDSFKAQAQGQYFDVAYLDNDDDIYDDADDQGKIFETTAHQVQDVIEPWSNELKQPIHTVQNHVNQSLQSIDVVLETSRDQFDQALKARAEQSSKALDKALHNAEQAFDELRERIDDTLKVTKQQAADEAIENTFNQVNRTLKSVPTSVEQMPKLTPEQVKSTLNFDVDQVDMDLKTTVEQVDPFTDIIEDYLDSTIETNSEQSNNEFHSTDPSASENPTISFLSTAPSKADLFYRYRLKPPVPAPPPLQFGGEPPNGGKGYNGFYFFDEDGEDDDDEKLPGNSFVAYALAAYFWIRERPNTAYKLFFATLNGLGDIIAQYFSRSETMKEDSKPKRTKGSKKKKKKTGNSADPISLPTGSTGWWIGWWNARRTLSMAAYAGIVFSSMVSTWYVALGRLFPFATVSVPSLVKKVAVDQLLFAPFATASFTIALGLLEGNSLGSVFSNLKNTFVKTMLMCWSVWPGAQMINFNYVPLVLQPIFTETVSFLYNIVFSLVTH